MKPTEFIHKTSWQQLPEEVQHQARCCLLDTLGAAIGGRRTELSRIVHNFVASTYTGQGTHLWLDGREVVAPGAALANGMTIDALDIHDGHPLTKGHAGAAVVPASLATLTLDQAGAVSGQELLTTLVIGYEIALRAGIALHQTACDYHTSGAWNALASAAVTARRLGLDESQTRHALGIAEYHGPRSPMMRCIDHPTMVKDGSGWGAMVGVSAALLAQSGFTGAPALTVESAEATTLWADLGQNWRINEQYFKPHAVCRWAQPAIVATLALRQSHDIPLDTIKRIRIFSFDEAIRLRHHRPRNTEEAQYSLPFPVAAALVHGRLGPAELSGKGLTDPAVLALSDRIEVQEYPVFSSRFPAQRFARVRIETRDGHIHDSGEVQANWRAVDRPGDTELREKFRWLAGTTLPSRRVTELEEAAWQCADLPDAAILVALLAPPAEG